MNVPLVSIALATYNGEKYIKDQLDSLIAQDYPNLEIVISDDYSSDNTWSILQFYALRDDRIRLLPQSENFGYVNNFIRVFKECRGDFISPCDQDDIWYPNKTSRLIDEIGDSALIYCNNRFIDENNKFLGKYLSDLVPNFISGSDARKLIFSTSICGHTMLFKKNLIESFDILKIAPYIDWIISFVAAEKGEIKYLDEVLVDWRQHQKSTTFHVRNNIKGGKIKNILSDRKMLDAFFNITVKNKEFLSAVIILWDKWFNSYLNLGMFFFVLKYKGITHISHPAKFPALKYLFGYKLKKLIRPKYY